MDDHPALEADNGNITVQVTLIKKPDLLELHFSLSGEITVKCDRCLDYFDLPIRFDDVLYVKFGEGSSIDAENIIVLHPNEHEIDVRQYIYECISLSIPYKKVHPPDDRGNPTCNISMLKKLDELQSYEHEDDSTDPRWDKLKELKLNRN